MSWDSYIDNLIAQTKDTSGGTHCDKACIIGLDGAAWTSANHANALVVSTSVSTSVDDYQLELFVFHVQAINFVSRANSGVMVGPMCEAIPRDHVCL